MHIACTKPVSRLDPGRRVGNLGQWTRRGSRSGRRTRRPGRARAVFGTAGRGRSACASGTSSRRARRSSMCRPRRGRSGCGSRRGAAGRGRRAGWWRSAGREPVGWCAVEPRPAYPGLFRVYRVPWAGRAEDKADASVWAVTCFFVRAGFRRQGVSYALARAAVGFARGAGGAGARGLSDADRAGAGDRLGRAQRRGAERLRGGGVPGGEPSVAEAGGDAGGVRLGDTVPVDRFDLGARCCCIHFADLSVDKSARACLSLVGAIPWLPGGARGFVATVPAACPSASALARSSRRTVATHASLLPVRRGHPTERFSRNPYELWG